MDGLYKHNQEAYEAVKRAFVAHNRAAVVHATGTGKSYVIARISEDYEKVLVIAPNNFVLDETRKVCKSGVEFRTYASVMYDKCMQGGYDLIVLDEFHRSGAEKWGEGVQRLLDANPRAKVLGTSATHIRYLDGQRNMADELFDGHVVSFLPLREAIDQGILPNPTYVASLYSLGEEVEKRINRLNRTRWSQEKKDEHIRKLKGIANNWESSHGVPKIIRKYFDKDMKRIIVFCSKVNKASKAREWLGRWFSMAGYKRIRFYNIDYKEKRLEREMRDFQEDVEEGALKVAISVNMLNEGVHIPRVDGIIMLRSTISRIIIEQQIGRCLTANNLGRKPVVLDLVNNMDLINYDVLPEFGEDRGDRQGANDENKNTFPFTVIDECRDIRVFFEQLDREYSQLRDFSFDERIEEIRRFKEEKGELPNTINGGRSLFVYALKFRYEPLRNRHPECVDILKGLGFDMSLLVDRRSLKIERCLAFKEREGRIPMVSVKAGKEERELGGFLKSHWHERTHNTDEERLEICRLGLVSEDSEKAYVFVEEEKAKGNLPRDFKLGRKPKSVQVDEVIAYFKEHGTIPPLRDSNLMRVVQNVVASESDEVVRLYEAGVFNGKPMKLSERVANLLSKKGIVVDSASVDLSPESRMSILMNKYGTIERAMKNEIDNMRHTLRALFLVATDDEVVEYYRKGWYSLNYTEVRDKLKKVASKGLIDLDMSEIKKPRMETKMTDDEILAMCERLGRLPIMSHEDEKLCYCSIRNRWRYSKDSNQEYLQTLIDKGLYIHSSKKFQDICKTLNLRVPKEPRFKNVKGKEWC